MDNKATLIANLCKDFSTLRANGSVKSEDDVRDYLIDSIVTNAWGFRKSPLETCGVYHTEEGVSVGRDGNGSEHNYRADYVLYATSKVIVETKPTTDLLEDEGALNQAHSYAKQLNADELIVSNGIEIRVYVLSNNREKAWLLHTASVDNLTEESATYLANLFDSNHAINTANLRASIAELEERENKKKRVTFYEGKFTEAFTDPDKDVVKKWAIMFDATTGKQKRYTPERLDEEVELARQAFENVRTKLTSNAISNADTERGKASTHSVGDVRVLTALRVMFDTGLIEMDDKGTGARSCYKYDDKPILYTHNKFNADTNSYELVGVRLPSKSSRSVGGELIPIDQPWKVKAITGKIQWFIDHRNDDNETYKREYDVRFGTIEPTTEPTTEPVV